jgi:hypothetical protein
LSESVEVFSTRTPTLPPAGATAEALVADAYDDVSRAVWPLALLSVQAHLAKLVDEGRVRTGDRVRYTAGG